jgi:hypothetical protein
MPGSRDNGTTQKRKAPALPGAASLLRIKFFGSMKRMVALEGLLRRLV